MNLKQYIPAFNWLNNYKKDNLKGDLSAGLTVGVMLIPQGMAYAMIAGLPPIYGLYASTLPLIIYAFLFYRNIDRFEQVEERPDLLIFRFDAQLYFANTSFFRESLEELVAEKGTALKTIILCFNSINNIDSSAAHALEEIVEDYQIHQINVLFTGVRGPVRDAMERAHLMKKIGAENCFMGIQEAVDFIDGQEPKRAEELEEYTLQTNA